MTPLPSHFRPISPYLSHPCPDPLEGVTVRGHKVSDQEQIVSLAESLGYLLGMGEIAISPVDRGARGRRDQGGEVGFGKHWRLNRLCTD